MAKPRSTTYVPVETRDGMILYSWREKELQYYAIAVELEGGGDDIVEVFRPQGELKGNALRAEALKRFRAREKSDYRQFWPTAATCASEVQVGMVIVTEPEIGPGVLYDVVDVGKNVVFAVSARGTEVPWTKQSLDTQIKSSRAFVTRFEALPDREQEALRPEEFEEAALDILAEEVLSALPKPMGLRGAGDYPGKSR